MPRPKNPKVEGERAECAFAWQAMEHGLTVSKPYGDSAPYDFIVDSPRSHSTQYPAPSTKDGREKLWRVQVKSAASLSKGQTYQASTRHFSNRYRLDEVDFFAVWVRPLNAWYIVPAEKIVPATSACFYPQNRNSRGKYEKYREAWRLLS